MKKKYNEFVRLKGIATSRVFIDRQYAQDNGVEILIDGSVVGYYLENGFSYLSMTFPKEESRVSLTNKMLWRMCFTAVSLNPEKSVDCLVDFMYLYLKCYYTPNGLEPDVSKLRDMIDFSFTNGLEEKITVTKKYFWIKPLSIKEKQKIVMENMKERSVSQTIKIIDNCIDAIAEEGVKFITIKEIVDTAKEFGEKLSKPTVSRYMPDFREKIDEYNLHIHNTENYQTFRKTLSIFRIKEAIAILDLENERLSRRNVANKAGIHFTTVQKLWESDEVQSMLNKFNEVV